MGLLEEEWIIIKKLLNTKITTLCRSLKNTSKNLTKKQPEELKKVKTTSEHACISGFLPRRKGDPTYQTSEARKKS